MSKYILFILDNKYVQMAAFVSLVGSPLADIPESKMGYYIFFSLIGVLAIAAFTSERRRYKLFQVDFIHLPLVIKVGEGPDVDYVFKSICKEIEEKYKIDNLEKELRRYFGLTSEELCFEYNGSIYDFDRLVSFARIIKYKLNLIEKQLNGRVKFHLAYYKRPSVGFLVGTLFRTEGLVVYQNNDFENTFYPVAHIDSRRYKERVDFFSKYGVTENIADPNDHELLIVIESASHSIKINSKSLSRFANIISVKLVENGTIPYSSDWVEYAAEIYNVINKAQTTFKKITIAHAMPEAVSVIVGMAIENYWNVDILQYDQQEYNFLFNMQKIKYYV